MQCYVIQKGYHRYPKTYYCKFKSDIIGIWSNKLFVVAALTSPGVVGWSGIWARKISRWFLKREKSPEFSFRRLLGSKLNRRAPCAPRDLSLAFLTLAGEFRLEMDGITYLPLLSLHCQATLYPSTRPWDNFHKKHIWFLGINPIN